MHDPLVAVPDTEIEKVCCRCDHHITGTATVREGRLYCSVTCAKLHDGPTLPQARLTELEEDHEAHLVGWIPNEADCCRMRLAIKSGIAANFQKDPDHVEFFESAQDTADGRQVPVFLAYASQTPPETRESMFQWVRGCVYGRSSR